MGVTQLFALIFFSFSFLFSESKLCLALFSKRQSLWPALDSAARRDSARLGVLPVYLERYAESKPCDSCHRLSEDGMEFFLGNALLRIFTAAWPGREVELAAPHWELLRSRGVEFPRDLDSLNLPWDGWVGGEEPLIYRPREFMAAKTDKSRLDKVAGALGFSHVFVVRGFRVEVGPKFRDAHTGSLRWSWRGALYNASEGRFEWAVDFSEDRSLMDLDDDLEPGLTKVLGDEIRKLPAELEALLGREPR